MGYNLGVTGTAYPPAFYVCQQLNSLNEKQLVSKEWLVEKLNEYKYPFRHKLKKDRISIMLLCSWYGMLAYKLIEKFDVKKIDRIYCVDFDPKSKMIANRLFRKIDNENLQKGILTQVNFRDKDIKFIPKISTYLLG